MADRVILREVTGDEVSQMQPGELGYIAGGPALVIGNFYGVPEPINTDALAVETAARLAGDATNASVLSLEANARLAGDNALAAALADVVSGTTPIVLDGGTF